MFFKRLWKIIKIVVPGILTKEFGYATLSAVMMVVRTYYDLWILSIQTTIEANIVAQNGKATLSLFFSLCPWPVTSIPPSRRQLLSV